MKETGNLRQTLTELKESGDAGRVRDLLVRIAREIPSTPENLDLLTLAFELADNMAEASDRRAVLFDVVNLIPQSGVYAELYKKATESAINLADSLEESQRRITELKRLAATIPSSREHLELRRRTWRLLLGLSEKPRNKEVPLSDIARELPKASDLAFYRRYTLLGILSEMPKTAHFQDIYTEAMGRAIDAAATLDEAYYQKYALSYIAGEIPEAEWAYPVRRRAFSEALRASFEIKDAFARQHALIDMLKALPKTQDYFPLLQDLVTRSLGFFTVRRWMEDIEVTDVIDFVLSAEEAALKDSKKRRFDREKYAKYLARELEDFGVKLNDVRFIEALKPYTHVWVQPRVIREAVKKVVEHLEGLGRKFHGREVTRPAFVSESHPEGRTRALAAKKALPVDCIAIDLGATNTVIMRKRSDTEPDFVRLDGISREYGPVSAVPTLLSAETNAIGAEAAGDGAIRNIKQLLLDGNPKGAEHMERFLRILYQHLKAAVVTTGWFSLIPRNVSEKLYVTVPLGFSDYRSSLKGILAKAAKGGKFDFIEEPLAAAIGYEVAGSEDKLVMVIDFGGSTLDVMLLRLNVGEVHVVARPERAQVLGGADIDLWLAEYLAPRAGLAEGADIPPALVTSAEELKIALSMAEDAPFVYNGREVCRVTRIEFEEMLDKHGFYARVDRAVSYVLRQAAKVGVRKDAMEAVILTGGSSLIPSFKDNIGYLFPELRERNVIYDHSPFAAVSKGAALFGTKEVVDRHLGMAYALRYVAGEDKEAVHSYTIVLDKGESLPFERTYRITPAEKLGPQKEIYLELFGVPESRIVRRWVKEGEMEYIKQEFQHSAGAPLESHKAVTLAFDEPVEGEVDVTFVVAESGDLKVRSSKSPEEQDTGIRLQ